jgi:hypothetical protein
MSSNSSSSSTLIHSGITSIPLLQRVFLFSTLKLSDIAKFATVHSSWQDCCHNYSRGIFASWVAPTKETVDEILQIHSQKMLAKMRAELKEKKRCYEGSSSVSVSLPQQIQQLEGAIQNLQENPEMSREAVKDARMRDVKRRLSGGLVRGSQFGILWLVENILESPSPFAVAQQQQVTRNYTLGNNQNDDEEPIEERAKHFQVYDSSQFIVDPAKCTFYSGTPIFAAVSGGNINVVKYLIAKTNGAVIGKKALLLQNNNNEKAENVALKDDFVMDLNERTPLFNAAAIGPEMMQVLIDAGCDHRILDYAGDDVVNFCAANGYLESMKWLLDVRFPNDLRRVELALNPPLVLGGGKGDDKHREFVLENYPKDFRKSTRALNVAVAVGQAKIAEYLIKEVGCLVEPELLSAAARSYNIACVRAVIDGIRIIEGVGFAVTAFSSAIFSLNFRRTSESCAAIAELLEKEKVEFATYAKPSVELKSGGFRC